MWFLIIDMSVVSSIITPFCSVFSVFMNEMSVVSWIICAFCSVFSVFMNEMSVFSSVFSVFNVSMRASNELILFSNRSNC